jgi:hypothetical protein
MVDNLPNGIAAYNLAYVTNFAITVSGTMLLNGLEHTNAQPAYFHNPPRASIADSETLFIHAVTRCHRAKLLLMNKPLGSPTEGLNEQDSG